MSLKDTDVRTPGDEAIAKKFKLSLARVRQLVKQGAEHEKEHNTNLEKAKQVARDHIGERPDYYKMLAKAEKTKVKLKEEAGTGGVRGLGYVSGDPAGTDYVQNYLNTNAMAYEDENGNKLGWIKQQHADLHNKGLGFQFFNPTNVDGNKNFIKEGISAGPERDTTGYQLGDLGGGRTLMRPLDVKESIKNKAKKAVATGLTLANIATLGQVAGGAAEGRGSPKRDIVAAATALPGTTGWGATGVHYAKKAYDAYKAKRQMKEDKDPCWKGYEQVGMKKKGGRKVPNCVPIKETGQVMSRYTERPTYENRTTKGDVLPQVGGVARGIYEDWQSVNRKDKTDGLSQKAVDAYKRENPGSKLQTAVTEKNPTGKRASRRKSFCSRMGGMKKRLTSAKTARDPDSRINKALRRWNCEEEAMEEGYVSIGHWGNFGDGFKAKKTYGTKPKEKPASNEPGTGDTYKGSNAGKKVRFAKTVKEGQIDELKAETLGSYIKKASASRKEALNKGGAKADVQTWGKRQRGITTAINKLTREAIADKDWNEISGGKLPENHNKPDTRYAPGATGITKTIYEETTMDNKNLINEAFDNILDNNLNEMKQNLLTVLQEKAMEKLEERKKEIASNYFAQ